MKHKKTYTLLGLMSGTSLDGLDLALCRFTRDASQWKYRIIKAETLPYPAQWKERIAEAHTLDALSFISLHNDYGRYLGEVSRGFLETQSVPEKDPHLFGAGTRVDAIASHGHTIFHQPQRGITFQIGNGASIAAVSGQKTVCDFRTLDVALGGQGAPLVPAGDELLFGEYDYCLNLGGFANISFRENKTRIAFDICPANWILNHYSRKLGREYDKNGDTARTGSVHEALLQSLNQLDYYHSSGPRSLGREWVEQHIYPCIESYKLSVPDILRTLCRHITEQIVACTKHNPQGTLLVTGGGAHNQFLIECLSSLHQGKVIIPRKEVVDYKEALIFAFLGMLRLREEPNCLQSVTGCSEDHSGGVIFLPPNLRRKG